MRKMLLALVLSAISLSAWAQQVSTPSITALACAYNSGTQTGVSGQFMYVQCDSTGRLVTSGGSGTVPGGLNTQLQYNNNGAFGGISGATTDGTIVSLNSPIFNAPVLGTPASGVATNLTGTAAGLTAGNVTTNANASGPITLTGNTTSITAQTGTGTTFVVSNAPTVNGLTNSNSAASGNSADLLNGTLLTGAGTTNTLPQMLLQPSGTAAVTTWATGGTPLGMNLVSGFSGNPIDIHVAGGPSLFKVASTGAVTVNGQSTFSFAVGGGANFVSIIDTTNTQTLGIGANSAGIGLINNASKTLRLGTNSVDRITIAATADTLSWGASSDASITRTAAASLQFGLNDAASAIAQTTRVQSVVAGTAAANGANWTLIGSLPTGTGTSGDIIFQTGVKTGSGTTQGTPTTAMAIKGETQQVNFAGQINVAAMTQTAVAQSGTVCYNSGTGAVTYDSTVGCLTSTMTEKDNWQNITPQQALAVVLKMQAGSYTYKKGRGLPEGPQVGLSAEQIETLDDRLVGHRPNGDLAGVRYQQASALYPMAIQQLNADNDNLRAELRELQRRVIR